MKVVFSSNKYQSSIITIRRSLHSGKCPQNKDTKSISSEMELMIFRADISHKFACIFTQTFYRPTNYRATNHPNRCFFFHICSLIIISDLLKAGHPIELKFIFKAANPAFMKAGPSLILVCPLWLLFYHIFCTISVKANKLILSFVQNFQLSLKSANKQKIKTIFF